MTEKNCTNCTNSSCVLKEWVCYYDIPTVVEPDYCCKHWEAME